MRGIPHPIAKMLVCTDCCYMVIPYRGKYRLICMDNGITVEGRTYEANRNTKLGEYDDRDEAVRVLQETVDEIIRKSVK